MGKPVQKAPMVGNKQYHYPAAELGEAAAGQVSRRRVSIIWKVRSLVRQGKMPEFISSPLLDV
jgi:hypothetical protein